MNPFAIATAAGASGPQFQPPPEPVRPPTQDTAALPQQASSAQQAAALPDQATPRPVEDAERSDRKETRQRQDSGNGRTTRNRAEGKGLRLDLRA